MNTVEMSGFTNGNFKLDHEKFGVKFYTLKIKSYRASGAYDEINVVVSNDLIDVSQSIENKYLYILGEIRTHNIKDSEGSHLKVVLYANKIDVIDVCGNTIDSNFVVLQGYLCKKNQLRVTPLGRKICDAIIAVNRDSIHNDYVPVIFWGKLAEQVSELNVGSELNVEGRLQSRNYSKNGVTKTAFEVSVQKIK